MPARLGLAVAGLKFGFSFASPPFAAAMARRYYAFRVPAAGRTFAVGTGGPARPPFSPAVLSGPVVRGRRGDFDFSFDRASGKGEAVVSPRAQSFDSFLRTLSSALLNESGGALVHACGLAVGGRAYVFIGRSGAGKSTLARLAADAGAEVISDEIVPLRMERGRFYVYGSPFWGEMRSAGRPSRLPLAGIYPLRKSRVNSLRPVQSTGIIPLFLRCCLNFSKGPAAAGGLLGTAA
ncbi:MAG: hypothetical protein RQ748_07310, partial [Elusimicrobiales bacterium]|nr:hypothetical protein [Elusimicrobiales bacterium]